MSFHILLLLDNKCPHFDIDGENKCKFLAITFNIHFTILLFCKIEWLGNFLDFPRIICTEGGLTGA